MDSSSDDNSFYRRTIHYRYTLESANEQMHNSGRDSINEDLSPSFTRRQYFSPARQQSRQRMNINDS